ncbi:PRC-barrel domain-containing protein [Microvirga roseola]|uniref:PRC-barrel domain-containing protein n=1 Tax=Microvirga roseola TaxID=2883126 RepID=UPI001E4D1A15|nr:PRC-barrel domain-containing protein [Microvirga roseola]
MRTYHVFQSASAPDLRAFADDAEGHSLPPEHGPWTLVRRIEPDEEWNLDVSRAMVTAGLIESGLYLWGPVSQAALVHPIIGSDRVEGTAVFDQEANQIGTIKRLLIEKVSGRVILVDVAFGGFLGIGAQHRTIPWEKLSYDKEREGYRTDITEAQVRNAPAFHGDDEVWFDRKREQNIRDYWNDIPRGPI